VNSPESPLTSSGRARRRNIQVVGGAALWVVALVPPVLSWTTQYEFAQAVQFCLFAVVVPYLFVAGGLWRWLGLTSNEPLEFNDDGSLVAPRHLRAADRWARSKLGKDGHGRAVSLLILFVAQCILWRSAPVVDALIRHPWLSSVESLALIGGGVFLWLELVDSAPFRAGAPRPYRIGVAAVAMWTVWVIAYLMAMAQNTWYRGFVRVDHQLLSRVADQQVTTGLMWFIAAAAFLPVVFVNLYRWLQSEEDPDEELYHLVRKDRTRGFFGTN
jgi:cytochrome c oxidase assembly factor CtaG